MRGFFGVAVYNPKKEVNIGTLFRTANLMGAKFLAVIGKRYSEQSSDTMKTPRHIPLFYYDCFDDFYKNLPNKARLVGVELDARARPLKGYHHPQQAVYLLGAEDTGLPQDVINKCHDLIVIETPRSLNVAVAGSLVLYDRAITKCPDQKV